MLCRRWKNAWDQFILATVLPWRQAMWTAVAVERIEMPVKLVAGAVVARMAFGAMVAAAAQPATPSAVRVALPMAISGPLSTEVSGAGLAVALMAVAVAAVNGAVAMDAPGLNEVRAAAVAGLRTTIVFVVSTVVAAADAVVVV